MPKDPGDPGGPMKGTVVVAVAVAAAVAVGAKEMKYVSHKMHARKAVYTAFSALGPRPIAWTIWLAFEHMCQDMTSYVDMPWQCHASGPMAMTWHCYGKGSIIETVNYLREFA